MTATARLSAPAVHTMNGEVSSSMISGITLALACVDGRTRDSSLPAVMSTAVMTPHVMEGCALVDVLYGAAWHD